MGSGCQLLSSLDWRSHGGWWLLTLNQTIVVLLRSIVDLVQKYSREQWRYITREAVERPTTCQCFFDETESMKKSMNRA